VALVAAGHTNAEIAAALVISVGTVKDHVHSILAKTGLRSRAAVARAWRGHAPQRVAVGPDRLGRQDQHGLAHRGRRR
jgi:DNA-binding NarL/FixJ family response regulator